MAFPVGKLAYLMVRQLSKPVANTIKQQATQHPSFRRFCVAFAQRYHRLEMNVKIRFLGHSPREIPDLSETRAIQVGAEAIGELVVFTVAGATVILEYNRGKYNERKKENAEQERIETLEETIRQQGNSIHQLETVVFDYKELHAQLLHQLKIQQAQGKMLDVQMSDRWDTTADIENQARQHTVPSTTHPKGSQHHDGSTSSSSSWWWPFSQPLIKMSTHTPPVDDGTREGKKPAPVSERAPKK
eukprot:Clim_evm18s232 gene=Clim_evmTU18s232